MSSQSENNRRIAKNTLLLYVRTFITMIVSLYTSRIMLQALGVENYGVNNVVGSIVSMTGLITGVMSAAISRYLTFELGRGDMQRLKTVFSTSVNVQFIMSAIVVVVLELIGVWFLNSQANIPDGRMVAANWVMQCSIIATVLGLMSSPYSAVIIAHERMSIYAYMSIVDVTFKLVICFGVKAYGGDRLIMFSILNLVVSFLMTCFYAWYSASRFEEARYDYHVFDKPLLKEMTAYSGWNLFGNTSWILNNQGVNMLVNVFYGVSFNAARGIAGTVNGAIQNFVGNFSTAFSPQITKSYASGDIDYAIKLANRGTKVSWLMSLLFLVPVFLEADTLLSLWLVEVPDYAAIFLRFALFESLAVTSGQTLYKLILATGDIKRYQIVVTAFSILVFPISWIAFLLKAPVWTPYLVFIVDFFLLNIIRCKTLNRLMNYSGLYFVKDVLVPCVVVTVISFIVPMILSRLMLPGLFRFIIVVTVALVWTGACIIFIGLNRGERKYILDKSRIIFTRWFKHD